VDDVGFYEIQQPVHELQIQNRKKTGAIRDAQTAIIDMLRKRSVKKIKDDLKILLELMLDAEVY
jgi:hypothetical protein